MAMGDQVEIGRGRHHRLVNNGADDLQVIEIQTGDYLGEDDIVRIQDQYGRA